MMRRARPGAPRLLCAALLLALLSGAAASRQLAQKVTPRIVGGTQTSSARYPYVVSLRDASGNHYCGGSLIAPRIVLTAAHCVYDAGLRTPTVHIGRSYTAAAESGYEVRKAVAAALHPQYVQSTSANDIALLLLDSASSKTALQLPSFDLSLAPGTQVVAIGFGTTSEGSATLSATLQQVTVSTISDSQCKSIYGSNQILAGMMCAGVMEGGRDSCQGDSGGPLILPSSSGQPASDLQLAVVSWGYGCARPGLPGVYTSVSYHRNWMQNQIAHADGVSGGVSTGRKGCAQHGRNAIPRNLMWHCYTVGGTSCARATASSIKGAAWVTCGPDAPTTTGAAPPPVTVTPPPASPPPATPSPPPTVVPPVTVTVKEPQPGGDPRCACAEDGVSGGVPTNRKGCKQHGRNAIPRNLMWHCYTVGGASCPTATPSSIQGAAWRECTPNS